MGSIHEAVATWLLPGAYRYTLVPQSTGAAATVTLPLPLAAPPTAYATRGRKSFTVLTRTIMPPRFIAAGGVRCGRTSLTPPPPLREHDTTSCEGVSWSLE